MNPFKIIFLPYVLVALFPIGKSYGQENPEKIIGCWILRSMEYIEPEEDAAEMARFAKGTVTCFLDNGKFTTKNAKDNSVITGSYHVSQDGKKFYQSQVPKNNDVDVEGEILILDEKVLEIRADIVILKFDRKA